MPLSVHPYSSCTGDSELAVVTQDKRSVSLGESIPTTVMRSGSDAFHIFWFVRNKERSNWLSKMRNNGNHSRVNKQRKRQPSLKTQS